MKSKIIEKMGQNIFGKEEVTSSILVIGSNNN